MHRLRVCRSCDCEPQPHSLSVSIKPTCLLLMHEWETQRNTNHQMRAFQSQGQSNPLNVNQPLIKYRQNERMYSRLDPPNPPPIPFIGLPWKPWKGPFHLSIISPGSYPMLVGPLHVSILAFRANHFMFLNEKKTETFCLSYKAGTCDNLMRSSNLYSNKRSHAGVICFRPWQQGVAA